MIHHHQLLGVAIIFASLLPSSAQAQRRTMGGAKEADWNAIADKKAPAGPTISAKDFEKISPFRALLDKKKDLKLSETQLATLTTANTTLLAANAQRFTQLDSLKKEAKPKTSGDPSTEDEVRIAVAGEALQAVVKGIRESFDDASKKVDGLDDEQKASAVAILAKNATEMQEMLREKMGGRGGPAGALGAGRGGRPPA